MVADVARQVAGADEHAMHHHWITSAYTTALIVIAVVIASTRRPGARILGVLAGAALAYLGAAAVTVPTNAGSWAQVAVSSRS
jgi:hypothetical protein